MLIRFGHCNSFFIDFLGGLLNLMTPHGKDMFSLSFLPAISSSQSKTNEGLFELAESPSRALNLASCVVSRNLRYYKDIVRCGKLGAEIPGHRLSFTDSTT